METSESAADSESADRRLDIIGELYPMFPHVISKIFSLLSPQDLCRASCVSVEWRNACADDPNGNRRRHRHVRRIRKLRKSVGQENWPIKQRTPVADTKRKRVALTDVVNVYHTRSVTRLAANVETVAHTLSLRNMR